MIGDLRLAFRSLRRSPGFAVAAILTLAIGIAANSTVFTLINAVLFRPMPFEDPGRLVDLGSVAYLDMQEWKDRATTLGQIAALDATAMSVADEGQGADRYDGAYVSANAFAMIGRAPELGRDFRADDDQIGAAPVTIISHHLWETRYGSDPGIVGETIRVNGVPTTVIGVMPDRFAFPQISLLWLPLSQHPGVRGDAARTVVETIGRLRPDATVDHVAAELGTLVRRQIREQPDRERREPSPLGPYRAGIGTDTPVSVAFSIMMGAVAFVLLIACANVANLMLVRAAAHARDVSVRISLGASRWAIVRQLLAESVLLSAVAAGVALVVSVAAIRLAVAEITRTGDAPYWLDFSVDARIFAFFAAVCLGTAMLAGLAPAWVSATGTLTGELSESGRTLAGTRRRRRWTSAFVVGQLSLALVLLTGTGAMIRSLLAQTSADAGVDTSQLVTARLELPPVRYGTADERREFYRGLEDSFTSMPGMQTSFASAIPLGGAPDRPLVTDLHPDTPPERRPEVGQLVVSANYFDTLGAGAVRGRSFHRGERERVAVINERLAAMYFGGINPVGRRIGLAQSRAPGRPAEEWLTIVGVAPDVRQESTEGGDFDPIVYLPYAVNPASGMFVITRSAAGTGVVAAAIRAQVLALDPNLPVFDVSTADDRLAADRWAQRFATSMFATFAAIALLLAVIGLYAVTAYAAAERTREIGVRIALGARRAHVAWLVVRRAAVQLGIGLVIGLAGGVSIAIVLPSQLTGVSGVSPGTFLAVATLLVAVGVIASLVPARRATRMDPVAALRLE